MFSYLILFLTVFNLVSNVKSKELELTSLLTQIMDKNRINGILYSARSVTCNYRGHDPQGVNLYEGGDVNLKMKYFWAKKIPFLHVIPLKCCCTRFAFLNKIKGEETVSKYFIFCAIPIFQIKF